MIKGIHQKPTANLFHVEGRSIASKYRTRVFAVTASVPQFMVLLGRCSETRKRKDLKTEEKKRKENALREKLCSLLS